METIELDRIHVTQVLRDRKLTITILKFFAFIPLPAILMGYWQLASLALLLLLIYFCMHPGLMEPSKAEVDELLRAGSSSPRIVKTEQLTGQTMSDKMYGDLMGKDESTMTPDGELYASMHAMQQITHS